jgi:ABC-type enterochelin transport system permease subunit
VIPHSPYFTLLTNNLVLTAAIEGLKALAGLILLLAVGLFSCIAEKSTQQSNNKNLCCNTSSEIESTNQQ